MDEFTDDQLWILCDMIEEWSDKDRHNELRTERNYEESDIDAFGELYVTIKDEMRKRRLTY